MEIKKAEFLITVAEVDKILQNTKNEFAFVGRSNVGKSSLINALTKNGRLAKTGQTAGVTKNINYFSINNGEFNIVDLPGYGYHKAGKSEEEKWSTLLEGYLLNSGNLKLVFILIDSRREASDNDRNMLRFLSHYQIPFVVLVTKVDKIKKSELSKNKMLIAHSLALGESNVVACSSETNFGISKILSIIDNLIK